MRTEVQKRLALFTVFGLAWWFFGNLYEAIVISPNWIVNSPDQLKRLHEFFVNTSPTVYFVPLTQLATLPVWLLWGLNKNPDLKKNYRMAGIAALLLTGLNIFIVSTIVTKIFGDNYLSMAADLHAYCFRWNVLNAFRMLLTFTTLCYMFNAFRKLDKMKEAEK
jgi:hypothetical protein